LDKADKVGVADGLGGLNLVHLAVEGGPVHAFGLVDGIPMPPLARLADGPVIGAVALRAVGETMGLAGGEDARAAGLVELGDEVAALGASPPPAPVAEGVGVVVSSIR
jgi:hypothetical protein